MDHEDLKRVLTGNRLPPVTPRPLPAWTRRTRDEPLAPRRVRLVPPAAPATAAPAEQPPAPRPKPPAGKRKKPTRKQQIIAMLRESPEPLDARTIAARLGITAHNVHDIISRMARDGSVKRCGSKTRSAYRLPVHLRHKEP